MKAWGLNASSLAWNLTNVPADLTNVVAIAAGGLHTLALRTNGTVEAFGINDDGQTNVPAGLTNVVAISAGGGWSMALQANGQAAFFGNTNLPSAVLPTNMLGVKAISAGFQHNLALASDGLPPLLTYPPVGFAPVGGSFTFSLTGVPVANVQYQWQFNGTNITGATNSTLTLTGVNSADVGNYQVVISNGSGRATSLAATFNLSYPPQILSTTPAAPSTNWINTNITLSVGVAQSDNPLSYQWQFNGTNIAAATNSVYTIYNPVAANEGNYTVVITNSLGSTTATWTVLMAFPGMVEAWGSDDSGECNRPVSLTNAAAIAAGDYHSTAVSDSGTIVQWGEYFDGALVSPPPHTNYVATAAGMDHDIGLLADGTVVTWGCADAYANYVPSNLPPAQAVACGSYHNVALLTNGTVVAWGVDAYGVTNVPSDLTNCTAIAATYVHSLALKADGTVEAWGYNGDGECDVPAGLSNVVAIAAGGGHCLALKSDGTVVAWGYNGSGQTNVPAGLSNVISIAAGWEHSVALKNDGVTLVAWGDNSSGQTNLPPTPTMYSPAPPYPGAPFPGYYTTPPIIFKTIAAGGDHTLAAIISPLVQYPVDVTKDLLLIYNTNSLDSSNVCQYYLTHRPKVSNANVLGIGCTTNDPIYPPDYTNIFLPQVQAWLSNNPTKRPLYVILFQNLPTEVDWLTNMEDGADQCAPSVQYQLHYSTAPGWYPYVTAINMNGLSGTNFNSSDGTNDCIAYINKIVNMASNNPPGTLFISASAAGSSNTNWYFDYAGGPPTYPDGYSMGVEAEYGVTNVDPTASVITTTGLWNGGVAIFTLQATNVEGYFTGGWDGGGDSNMFVDGRVSFSGNSGWFIMTTVDSYDGQRVTFQAGYLTWFATNSFGGTNYSNTPVGAVTTVEEPSLSGKVGPDAYYGGWASGKSFAISAWAGQAEGNGIPGLYFQAVGDPFVRK